MKPGYCEIALQGERTVFSRGSNGYPAAFQVIDNPPEKIYVLGNPEALQEGLAVVGARRATPYGLSCARRFATLAAEKGIVIISGGARGCDSEAHKAALNAGTPTVVFLGGGCNMLYPAKNVGLFEEILKAGGALVSEHPWEFPPLPYCFRLRNRLIASLARATLIVEAGLPSGTFSTADAALAAGREVLAVPGAITSVHSRGANRLILQGATPVVDEESFEDALTLLYPVLKSPSLAAKNSKQRASWVVEALQAESLTLEELFIYACQRKRKNQGTDEIRVNLMMEVADSEAKGLIARYPNGKYGPVL